MSRRRAVILSSVRTGSTWLGETLKQHPYITYDGELLPDAFDVISASDQPLNDESVWSYVQAFADSSRTTFHLWKAQSHQVLDKVLSIGFIDRFVNERGLFVIFLRRQNLFEWFTSIKVSQMLQVYTRRVGDSTPEVEPFEVDVEEIEQYMRNELMWWSLVRKSFKGQLGAAIMETTYGKLCEDYEGEVRRLFNFLALTPIAVKTPTLKMQTRDPKRLVTNYRELCDRFRGSIFQQYGFDG